MLLSYPPTSSRSHGFPSINAVSSSIPYTLPGSRPHKFVLDWFSSGMEFTPRPGASHLFLLSFGEELFIQTVGLMTHRSRCTSSLVLGLDSSILDLSSCSLRSHSHILHPHNSDGCHLHILIYSPPPIHTHLHSPAHPLIVNATHFPLIITRYFPASSRKLLLLLLHLLFLLRSRFHVSLALSFPPAISRS